MSIVDDQIRSFEAQLSQLKSLQAERAALAAAVPATASIREQVTAGMASPLVAQQQPAKSPIEQVAAAVMPAEVIMIRALMVEFQNIFKKVLTAEAYTNMEAHIKDGAPGIIPFLKSDTLAAFAQMLHDEYITFLATPPK